MFEGDSFSNNIYAVMVTAVSQTTSSLKSYLFWQCGRVSLLITQVKLQQPWSAPRWVLLHVTKSSLCN
jgi:hypothetical protein